MLTAAAPLQNNTILNSTQIFYPVYCQYEYAADDGGGDDGGGDDGGGDDGGRRE